MKGKRQGWHGEKKRHRDVQVATRTATKDLLRVPMVPDKLFLPDPIIPPCKLCGGCCKYSPCGIAPNEVYPIARYLGISLKDLFDTYLTGDYWITDYGDNFFAVPRRVGDKSGRFDKVDSDWNYPPMRQCIFLADNNLCRIHPVKPLVAKVTYCKLPELQYRERLSKEWKSYIKPRGKIYLEYADRINYEKLERDFGGA